MKTIISLQNILDLENPRADGSYPIKFLINVGNNTASIASGKFIQYKHWNRRRCYPKRRKKKLKTLSKFLNKTADAFEAYMGCQASMGKDVNLMMAKDFFSRDVNQICFFDFFKQQLDLWQFAKAENTLKSYRSTLNILQIFKPDLDFKNLNYEFIQKFDIYLRKVRQNSANGAFTKHKTFKSILTQAVLKGYMLENPYRNFKIITSDSKRNFLSIAEVKKVMNLSIPAKNGFLNRVRDLFLFSCFSGLRFSDVMNLKAEHIKKSPDRIEIKIIKTQQSLTIPLSLNAKSIIQKYHTQSENTLEAPLLPKMSAPVVNRQLKVLMQAAGIHKNISFHCARHSFASNLIENGASLNHIKELLGHSSILRTEIYAKSLRADLITSMNKLNDTYNL
ncbi:site-specific integrase [Pedobacter aquatilis]|uniref:tyrosine-type recombinase/integrase n=1 Tax=Pedobacter aquatilis TaxID=351343 RepID=UPI0025B43318|nr:site-specific integrase [Pedobacter aquatilis]MDN3588490.1 site-specific integrase [Pedobacter aquatilis]